MLLDDNLLRCQIAEYLAGVHLASDAGRQAAQKAFLNDVLAVVPVCNLRPHRR
jgi:hypothetical protein